MSDIKETDIENKNIDNKNIENKENHLGFQIKTLDNLICRRIMQVVEAEDGFDEMTARHSWIIGYLCRNKDKDIYQKTIEEKFDLTKSTVASILKLMEKKGYIVRHAVEKDARLKKIMVTPLGEETHRKSMEKIMEMEREIRKCLTEDELSEYLRLTKKIKDKVKKDLERKEEK